MSKICYLGMTTYQPVFKSYPIKYAIMEVKDEETYIHGFPIFVNHVYYTPRYQKADRNKTQYYIEPLKNPDINAKRNRSQYLKQTSCRPSQIMYRSISVLGALYAIIFDVFQYVQYMHASGTLFHGVRIHTNIGMFIGLAFLVLTLVSIGGSIFERKKFFQHEKFSSTTVGIALICCLVELFALA